MVQPKRAKNSRSETNVSEKTAGDCYPKREFIDAVLGAIEVDKLSAKSVAKSLGITERKLKSLLSGKVKLDVEMMDRMAKAVGRNLHAVMR
jgi:phage antirepressor YoqD-like protein